MTGGFGKYDEKIKELGLQQVADQLLAHIELHYYKKIEIEMGGRINDLGGITFTPELIAEILQKEFSVDMNSIELPPAERNLLGFKKKFDAYGYRFIEALKLANIRINAKKNAESAENESERIPKMLNTPIEILPDGWEQVEINFWTYKKIYWRKKDGKGGYKVFYPNGYSVGSSWMHDLPEYIVKECTSCDGGYKHLIGTKVRIAILWTGFALSENFDYFFYGDLDYVKKAEETKPVKQKTIVIGYTDKDLKEEMRRIKQVIKLVENSGTGKEANMGDLCKILKIESKNHKQEQSNKEFIIGLLDKPVEESAKKLIKIRANYKIITE